MASNMYHTTMHCRHWTPDEEVGVSVTDGFDLDATFIHGKDQANKVGSGEGFLENSGSIVWAIAHKELDILESEGGMLGVGNAFEVFSRTQEE